MKKYLFLLIIPILFFIPSNVFAEDGISPSQTELFWRAENLYTGETETSQYVYIPGTWSNFGTNNVGFNLITLGSFLTYQQTSGTYSAKITYYISTSSTSFNPDYLNCGAWSSDVSNAVCSIESYGLKDNLYTYVVNYRWTNSSGFIQLTFGFDGGLYLIPQDTRFMYQIDSFLFNPSESSIIIDQNQTIINQNQTIINNQTQNTQQIIDNQNQNTDKEIESQKVCSSFDFNSTSFQGTLNSYGEFVSSSSANNGVTDFIKINSGDTLRVINSNTNVSGRTCFYNDSKKLVDTCISANTLKKGDVLTVPLSASYVRFTMSKTYNLPIFEICKNGNQALNDSLEEAEETRKGIWETIKELPSKFFDMLLRLFIPEDFSFLDDFMDSLSSKLGFIAEVPLAILDFLFGLVSTGWEDFNSITFPSIEIFGVNFWNEMEIDLTEAKSIFEPYKFYTDIACVILCVNTLRRWYDSFASGGGS